MCKDDLGFIADVEALVDKMEKEALTLASQAMAYHKENEALKEKNAKQAEAVRVLREALVNLHEFSASEHVKPYNGLPDVCHHPNCGESGGHLPWCPIGMAEMAIFQTKEFAK